MVAGLGWSIEGRTRGDKRGIGSVPFWQNSDADVGTPVAGGASAEGGGLGGKRRGHGARLWSLQLRRDRRKTQSSLWKLISKPGNGSPPRPVSSILFFLILDSNWKRIKYSVFFFFLWIGVWLCDVDTNVGAWLFYLKGLNLIFKEGDDREN